MTKTVSSMPAITATSIILLSIMILLSAYGSKTYALGPVLFGPVDHTYNLTIDNRTHPIRWGTLGNGTVESMQANYTTKTIRVVITDNRTDRGGLFFIELPKKVIDSINTEHSLSASRLSGEPMPDPAGYYIEGAGYYSGGVSTSDNATTLAIFYPTGDSLIVIRGTGMVPEFHLVPVILAIPVAIIVFLIRNPPGKK